MMKYKPFGSLPSGDRLARIRNSVNYRDGNFQNLTETPVMVEGTSYVKLMREFFFTKGVDREPTQVLPSVKTDLSVHHNEPVVIWFGHSSYLICIDGKNILVDPVFESRPSPIQFVGSKNFRSDSPYGVDDLPSLDLVIITHDHYDHLDYNTILKIRPKAKRFVTALGVGSHLEFWGINKTKITELDWWEGESIFPGMELIATPARHFSGRGLKRNQTLWNSFVLRTSVYSVFIGGDSGYDATFREIGNKYGPFDLAILECGQYNARWPYIHMMPEQTAQASVDLQARVFMPVHWARFSLSLHPWKDPIERVTRQAENLHALITTPVIGEPIKLGGETLNAPWWDTIK
ncbi:MAG: MBL fold metallo-hydrolase [Cyclobacteriaceae bacterium]|nr:MBL fold metallo-hydrolase [Cyclobacteriaceae bacterium]